MCRGDCLGTFVSARYFRTTAILLLRPCDECAIAFTLSEMTS